MPFYEYQCSACGHHHEELQKVTDRALRKCPACGRPSLKRLLSAPVFRLKGGGWYETDFKNDKEGKRNLAGEKEPAAAAPAADSKPDAAKDTAKDAPQTKKVDPEPRPAAANRRRKAARRKAAGRRPRR